MQPALKLTSDRPLALPPEELFNHLTRSIQSLKELLAHFKCTPEELHRTLHDANTAELLRLEVQTAALQVKLLALQYLPHSFLHLVELTKQTEKPEVARRACNTIIQLAGIATETKSQEPAPPPEPIPHDDDPDRPLTPEEEACEHDKLMNLMAGMYRMKEAGLDLVNLPLRHYSAFFELMKDFALARNIPDLFCEPHNPPPPDTSDPTAGQPTTPPGPPARIPCNPLPTNPNEQ